MKIARSACFLAILIVTYHKTAAAFVASSIKTGWCTTAVCHPKKALFSESSVTTIVALHLQNNDDPFSDASKNAEQDPPSDEEDKWLSRFADGDELKRLRSDLISLRENLKWAEAMKDDKRIQDLQKAIEAEEYRDPEVVYARAIHEIEEAKKIIKIQRREALLSKWIKEAAAARASLPRFNLVGLWVGSYGDHGYELVNITYSGDTIVATKVTGDKNVPRGEVSFKADLSPNLQASLEPIELSEESASKWGIHKLERYPGEGQVAVEGFIDNKFVDGQFIMFEDHFSFVWLPSRQHVFFGRPSPEVTLRMLRDIISKEDEVENMRVHLKNCWDIDVTSFGARQHESRDSEPFRRIKTEHDLLAMETLEPKSHSFSFWQVKKWMNILDGVLRDGKGDRK